MKTDACRCSHSSIIRRYTPPRCLSWVAQAMHRYRERVDKTCSQRIEKKITRLVAAIQREAGKPD